MITQNEFISLFTNTRFRYIHDVTHAIVQGNNILDMSWNEDGYGIFYTVNGLPPEGKADKSRLLSLNANYVDFDVDPKLSQEEKEILIQQAIMSGVEASIPTPTIINRTQKGAHLIWLYVNIIQPTLENLTKWDDVQKRLVHFYKGDTNATDPTRVLRLPYTLHLKDPANPFKIKIMSYKSEARCTLDELNVAVPKYSEDETTGSSKIPAKDILREGVKVGQGLRHMAIAQIAGLALKNAKTPEQIELAHLAVYGWDRVIVKSPEPFEQRKKELDNTLDSILKREMAGRGTGSVKNDPTFKPRLWTIGEILAHDFGEEDWLVEFLIPKQGKTALSGNPGDFKTWTTIHIAICVSRGTPVFGKFKAIQGGVLVIDEEDHLRLLKKRLELLGAKETDNIHYLSQNGIKVDNEKIRDQILEIVKEKNIKLLILDSLVRVHDQEENDAKGMAKVFSNLQVMIGAGASILFTHHHRKQVGFGSNNLGQSMRGSSDILAAVDCHITVEKKRDEEDRLIIKQTKLRQAEILKPFELKITKGELGPSGFEYSGDYDEKKLKAEEVSEALVAILGGGMKNRIELNEILKDEFGKTAREDGIKLAEEIGTIERVPRDELPKKECRKAYYRLPLGVSDLTAKPVNDLPTFQLPIGVGKQEDVEDKIINEDEWSDDSLK